MSAAKDDPVEDLTRELIILLDPDNDYNSDAGDWSTLADKMGCEITRIRWLGTQSSKTRLLIEKWVEDKRSFTELRDLLLSINRPDAASEVEKRLNVLEPNVQCKRTTRNIANGDRNSGSRKTFTLRDQEVTCLKEAVENTNDFDSCDNNTSLS